jgi:preprotein translocase subunit SecD
MGFIAVITLGAGLVLAPSFLDDGAQDRLTAQIDQVEGEGTGSAVGDALIAEVTPLIGAALGEEWIVEYSFFEGEESRLEVIGSDENSLEALSVAVQAVEGVVVEAGERDAEYYISLRETGFRALLPDTRINLGLDLQGGIDITLRVETRDAVLSAVGRDVQTIRAQAEDDGVDIVDVRRIRGETMLEVSPGETATQEEVLEVVRRGGDYRHSGDRNTQVKWWRYDLTPAQIEDDNDALQPLDLDAVFAIAEVAVNGEGRDWVSQVIRVEGADALEFSVSEEAGRSLVDSFVSELGELTWTSERVEGESALWWQYTLSEESYIEIADRSVEQALEGLRNRVDATGVKEPSIVKKGDGEINIQLPGIDNLQQAIEVIGTTAVLEFFLVDEEFEMVELERALESARDQMASTDYDDDEILNEWLIENGYIQPRHVLLWEYRETENGNNVRDTPYVLVDTVILTGEDINDAFIQWDRLGDPYVSLEFKPAGGRVFAQVTEDNVGNRFAIVLDRAVRSAPVIREKIGGGRAQISVGSGDVTSMQAEAQLLSMVLRTGALPAPVTIGQVRTVGAQLGADSVNQGVTGTLVGACLVLFFMFVFYTKVGVVANIALAMNVFYIMAMLSLVGATLTLPGIAGIALTVGMAVDANIIIFERIREEVRLGKTSRAAVDAGFGSALSAVLDANITTGIAGVVLFSYGSGPIKGFAVTLLIGIATTLFTAIFVSRTFMDFVVRKSTSRLGL